MCIDGIAPNGLPSVACGGGRAEKGSVACGTGRLGVVAAGVYGAGCGLAKRV